MMKTWHRVILLGMVLWGAGSLGWAQNSNALVDALVRKGVLTSKEAAEIQADLAKNYDEGSVGKIELSKHITKLKLYGKLNLRYQWDQVSSQNPVQPAPPAGNPNPAFERGQQNRFRYQFRVGAVYDFTDNMRSGIEFASGTANDSYNQTVGTGYGRFGVSLSLLYLEWEAADWLTLTAGKQENPLYTTSLVWDSDVNPEGLTEQAWWDLSDSFSIGFTAGQWIYDNQQLQVSGPIFGSEDELIMQFVQQVPMQYRWMEYATEQVTADGKTMTVTKPKEVLSVTFAPGFMTYMGGSSQQVVTASPSALLPNGTFDLNVVTAPGDVKWKAWGMPMKFYWDFAWNITGHERVQDVYLRATPAGGPGVAFRNVNSDLTDNIAWLAGLKVGTNKKKGDWSVQADWRMIGIGAVDPNLNDATFNLGYQNTQGLRGQFQYNLTDFLVGAVTYYTSWNYKNNLYFPTTVAGNGNGNGLAGATNAQVLQVDLKWKF